MIVGIYVYRVKHSELHRIVIINVNKQGGDDSLNKDKMKFSNLSSSFTGIRLTVYMFADNSPTALVVHSGVPELTRVILLQWFQNPIVFCVGGTINWRT